ncbi:hypothetical protein RO624_02355 [Ruminococcus bromii]|jgi:hypothetical protein|nr:hypothetical protein [Ruminococcus bromii]MDT4340963.1 hypothetical protein [Ruminococcus bromii]
MIVSYDDFIRVFLDKVKEWKFLDPHLSDKEKTRVCDGYLKRACASFNRKCGYNLYNRDDTTRTFLENFSAEDVDEIVDIITEGMVAQWFKPYANNADNLENTLNTTDYSGYSPAEILNRVRTAYKEAETCFKNRGNNYSFEHGDLTDLHI